MVDERLTIEEETVFETRTHWITWVLAAILVGAILVWASWPWNLLAFASIPLCGLLWLEWRTSGVMTRYRVEVESGSIHRRSITFDRSSVVAAEPSQAVIGQPIAQRPLLVARPTPVEL